jgi:hypothetical protein
MFNLDVDQFLDAARAVAAVLSSLASVLRQVGALLPARTRRGRLDPRNRSSGRGYRT